MTESIEAIGKLLDNGQAVECMNAEHNWLVVKNNYGSYNVIAGDVSDLPTVRETTNLVDAILWHPTEPIDFHWTATTYGDIVSYIAAINAE